MLAICFIVSEILLLPVSFGTTSVFVKPANLLVLPVIWLSSWISNTHRRPREIESTATRKLDRTYSVAVGILSPCALQLEICLGVILPSLLPANVAKIVPGKRVKFLLLLLLLLLCVPFRLSCCY